MKTRLLLLGALAALILTGCKKDSPETTEYSVSVTAIGGGTASASVDGIETTKAIAGVQITLQADANTGYEFAKWTVTGVTLTDDTANPATFTMPEGDVEVKAEFMVERERFDITIERSEHGTASAAVGDKLVDRAPAGEKVTLTATPNEGYSFVEWTIEGADIADPTANPATFTMPEGEVIIWASFTEREYLIEVATVTNGTLAATIDGEPATKALAGTEINIEATPNGGCEFVKWILTGATPGDETDQSTTFVITNSDVTVSAEFRVSPEYSITVTQSSGGTVTASATKALPDAEITITATPDSGYEFVKWTLTGVDPESMSDESTIFVMPHANVTVAAEFAVPVKGITINGVTWAPANVDMPGIFASEPEDAGLLYQYNIRTGWSVVNPLTGYDDGGENVAAAWSVTGGTGDGWASENDPCPKDWRLPIEEELNKLTGTTYVSNAWETSPVGRRYTDKASGESIFLPASGFRYTSDGTTSNPLQVGVLGMFWSSTAKGDTQANAFTVRKTGTSGIGGLTRDYALSVRCVKK